jgi:pimeloyl-ACP methyl ester carboxylesterase
MDTAAEAYDERLCVSPITSGGRRVFLLTSDGVSIDAEYRPARNGSSQLAIVVAHGFTGALERPAVRRTARDLSAFGAVVTFSFRGHGGSGGRSTVGDLEVLDLDAAVRWARELGYRRVATVGFSMGGSVVLRQAGRLGNRTEVLNAGPEVDGAGTEVDATAPAVDAEVDATAPAVDAVVSVSSPARWYYRGTAPMRRVHWLVTRRTGRAVTRFGLKTRINSRDWDPVPLSPVESVPYIAPTPLLIVHGDQDGYFPLDHPRSLAAAAGPDGAELWIEPGFGHAENAAGPDLLARIGQWLTGRVAEM